jgi:hypothetical protein
MAWWVLIAIIVATTVLTALLAPHPKGPGPGDFQAPTAEEGRAIPVIFGTVKIAGPTVGYYGDFHAYPIEARSGLFSSTTIGYRYYLRTQLILCHGSIGSTFQLTAGQAPDDIPVPCDILSVTADKITFRANADNLFGGDKREGGLQGEYRLYRGTQTQSSDVRLSEMLGEAAPEYRGLCYVMTSGYMGTTNVLKNLNFVLHRYPDGLGYGAIGADANPAEMIYEAMTNAVWGLARPSYRFDLSSFQAVAATLASEGMGMSLQWDTAREARELIADILRHIDAVLFTDPETGLWTLNLIRSGAGGINFTEDDLLEAPEFTRGSWEETWNEVKVKFTDGATFKPRIVQAHDSANQSIMGAVRSQNLEFLGFSNVALAQTVAMRELKAHSYPLAKVNLKAKRKAWQLRQGSAFTLAWPETGITTIALRVLAIDYGQLEEGVIKINAIEDAFYVSYTAFDPPDDSAWTDPVVDPEPPAAQWIQESPFEWLEAAIAQERVVVGAVRAENSSRGYEIWADEGAGYFHSNSADKFLPSGFLTADYLRTTSALDATGFTLESTRDLDLLLGTDAAGRARGDCLIIFEDTGEICAFQGFTDNGDGTWDFTNIVRGVYDTMPADHVSGTRVFIARDAGTWFLFPYRADAFQDEGGDQFIVVED